MNGEFTVKRIKKEKKKVTLMPENPNYKPVVIEGDNVSAIWGVVTYSVKSYRKK